MKSQFAVGATLLMACGGGTERSTSPSYESADARGGEMEIAGGETSEFSGGDIEHCVQVVSNDPLDLESADWAPWLARVEGRHEPTLGWQRLFEADTVTGFEEHTSVALDVSVLAGRAVVYGADGLGYEQEVCDGLRAEQIELAIEIATADGAVVASYRDWFERFADEDAPGGERLVVGRLNPDRDRDGVAFTGGLELAISPAFDGEPMLRPAYLSFDAEGVRGGLMPLLRVSDTREVAPIEGIFPDEPCRGSGRSVALDAAVDFIEQTPRQLFQRVAAGWGAAPIPATWSAREGGGGSAPAPTEVSLSAGEPTHACVSGSSIQVHAPLTLSTADGRVNVTRSFATSVADQDGAMTEGHSAWLPAARFEAQMGIPDVDFAGAEYGAIYLLNSVGYADGQVDGSLDVALWRGFEETATDYPRLTWCTSASCR